MNIPLSPARSTVSDIIARLRAKPDVGDVIAGVLRDTEDAKTGAVGSAEAATEAAAQAFAVVEDLRRKRQHQIDNVPHGRRPDPDMIAAFDQQIAAAEADLARKRARRDDLSEVARQARHQLERLRGFAAGLDPAKVRIVKAPTFPKGATLSSVRADLIKIDREIAEVEAAPLPRAGVIKALTSEIEALVAPGQPRIDPRRRDGSPARLASEFSIGMAGTTLVGDGGVRLLAWALKDVLIERLTALVPQDLPGAISDQERDCKLAELAAEKLRLERIEEALVRQAQAEGRTVQRRPDAYPLAILGIEVIGGAS